MTNHTKIAIVGGGIAGLYCLYKLARLNKWSNNGRKYQLTLFESWDRVGGRIASHRIYKDGSEEEVNSPRIGRLEDLEFYLEYGPMRLELDQQLLLNQLLTKFEINEVSDGNKESLIQGNKPFLVEFPPFDSDRLDTKRIYQLRGAESWQETGSDLLKLGIMRVFLSVELTDDPQPSDRPIDQFNDCIKQLRCRLPKSDFTWEGMIKATSFSEQHEQWRKVLDDWIRQLTERDYQNFREFAKIGEVFLYEMGFWNLLSDRMTHDAVSKLEQLGTFYHLLPENPNAIEWIIFWLRNLKSSKKLMGIFGGMQGITDALIEKIKGEGIKWEEQIKLNHRLRDISVENRKVSLTFVHREEGAGRFEEKKESGFDHVILALPYWPLKKLSIRNEHLFTETTREDFDAVFGFPMTKVFVGVQRAWWRKRRTDKEMTNEAASQFPTREVHYTTSKLYKGNEHKKINIEEEDLPTGAIMAYADRPASLFWANYVSTPGSQLKPECWGKSPGSSQRNRRLEGKVVDLIKQLGPKDFTKDFNEKDILFYGIRDWGREPYCGANHTWRPERRSWEVLARLGAFTINGLADEHFHVCGEAYSDYNGFFEGSLRSSVYALHHIDHRFMKLLKDDVDEMLKDDKAMTMLKRVMEKSENVDVQNKINVYFDELQGWVARLDKARENRQRG